MRKCRFVIALLLVCCCGTFARAAELTPSVSPDDLDMANTAAFADGRAQPAPSREILEHVLGLEPGPGPASWTVGGGKVREFRIAFTHPVAIGTIVPYFARQTGLNSAPETAVLILNANAGVQASFDDDKSWTRLQADGALALAPGTTARAVAIEQRFDTPNNPLSKLEVALLFKERYYSAMRLGKVAVGKAGSWLGSWPDKAVVAGVVALPGSSARTELLQGDAAGEPAVAPAAGWSALGDPTPLTNGELFRLATPQAARAVRLQAQEGETFDLVLPLVNMAVPAGEPARQATDPPYKIHYAMPMTGIAALDIFERKSGKLVRRLIAETGRDKGPVAEPWDLKDDKGAQVPPGDYDWKAIARPPFKNTYQLTAYNAGQPAWWAPPPGKGGGGWMGDHTPPSSACAMGDIMWFGSNVAESGHAIIATDLDGNKLWGQGFVMAGFRGGERVATDGRYGYIVNGVGVERVDPKNKFAFNTMLQFNYTRDVPGMPTWGSYTDMGAAAWKGPHDAEGRLYVSYNAPPVPWLQTSFLSDDIDLKTVPRAWLALGKGTRSRFDKNYNEAVYDELMQLYAAFLTGATPVETSTLPGTAIPSSTQAFVNAPKDGPLADTVTLVLKRPVDVGSVLVPNAATEVYALKPGAKLTDIDMQQDVKDVDLGGGGGGDADNANPFDEAVWQKLTIDGKAADEATAPGPAHAVNMVAPPGGMRTTALRFKTKRLDFAQVMNRRFADVAGAATRVYADGVGTNVGGWTIDRAAPINEYNPATMAMVWKGPVALRGVSFVNPRANPLVVDNWIGPPGEDPATALNDDSKWSKLGDITLVKFVGYFPQLPTSYSVDFGEVLSVQALRFRILTPFLGEGEKPGFGGVLAEHPLGDDLTTLPQELHARIDEISLPADFNTPGKILRHIPFHKPGNLAFDHEGTLYAVSDGAIVTVPLTDAEKSRVVVPKGALQQPAGIAIDAAGLIYVGDLGTQNVRVFDPKTGAQVRTVGKPGGHPVGPWDPNYMDNPTGLAIDTLGRLWISHASFQPKRISRWTPDGRHDKSFFGPTQYGGGGTMDENHRSVINYLGMKFVIDWPGQTWKLDSILFRPGQKQSIYAAYPDRAVYYKGVRYLIGDGKAGIGSDASDICVERDDIAVPMVAFGTLGKWDQLKHSPPLAKAFGALDGDRTTFLWVDRNGDGIPEPDEVQTTDQYQIRGPEHSVGDDLSLNLAGARLECLGILPNGVPNYDLTKLELTPGISGRGWTNANGTTFTLNDDHDQMYAADNKTLLWDYYSPHNHFGAFYETGFGYDRPPGMQVWEHSIIGHFKLGDEEYFVTNADGGDWFVYTSDGFMVGCIFGGPIGYGKRSWSMPDWTPGKVDLSDVRLPQEHYQGCVVKAEDGKVYAVAGHNHMSVVLVEGLEQLKRLSGPLTVTAADLGNARDWDVKKAALQSATQEVKSGKVYYVNAKPVIDGSLDDWPEAAFFTINDYIEHRLFMADEHVVQAQAALAYDADNLYVAARVQDDSPMVNSADNLTELFKHGDAVDVNLGLDPNADPRRKGAVPGDVRILISRVKGQMVAEIYRYVVAGAPAEHRVHYQSPVGDAWCDSVLQSPGAEIAIANVNIEKKPGYTLEAAIPWKDIGVPAPAIGAKLRGDVGVLMSDQNGVSTTARHYWSAKSQTVVSDLPSEARITPSLWGDLSFVEADKDMKFGITEGDINAP